MKLEFKFTIGNVIGFLVAISLFVWLCPLPENPVVSSLVCAGAGVLLFGMCFIVVTHKSIIRPANPARVKHKK